jgi:TP901 family phage tail tape measure protein
MSNTLNFSIGAELKELDRSLSKASSSIKDFAERNKAQFDRVGQSMIDLGSKLKYVSLAASAFGALAVKSFGEVDKSLREVNTLFGLTGDAADKNFGELQKLAKAASKEVGLLQTEISKGLYNAISAGVPQKNAFDFIVTAGKAAIGGVTDLNTAVDGLTTVINAFGKDFADAEAVSDSLFAAVQGGKTTFEELSASLFNIAPAAAAAKVSMEEVNAGIATLTASGVPTSVATTQLRAALTGLQRPSEELNSIFNQFGFANAQAAIEAKGLQFALDAVREASNGNNGALQGLLGSVEAVAAANVLAGTGAQKFNEEMQRQANAAGASAKAFDELEKSLPRQFERLKVALSNITIEIGSKLAPVVAKLTNFITKLAYKWDNLSEGTKNVIVVIGGLVAAAAPLLVVLGTIIKFLPVIGAGLALLTGPIGLVVLAIAAITAIVIKNWTTVKRWAEGLINYFIDLYNESIVFRAGIEAIALNFKNMFAVGKFIFQSLWTIIKAVVSQIVNQFKLLGGVIDAVLTFSPSKLKKSLSDYRKAITENVSGIIDAVGNDFNELTDSIVGNVETAINNVLTGKKEHVKFESDKKSLEKLEGDVATAVSDGVAKGLSGEGKREQIQGIAGGLQSLGIIDINIEPLREKMREIGDLVTAEMVYLKQLMMDFDAETRELIFSSIADTFSGLGEVIGNALAEGGNVLQAIGRSILNSMGQFLSSFGDQLIKYSIAALTFDRIKKSLFSGLGTPGAAAAGIAAGVALKALGSAISAGQSGGIGGGGATSSTPNVSSSSTFRSGATGGQNEFVFRIAGRDLVSVIDRNRQNTERIAG